MNGTAQLLHFFVTGRPQAWQRAGQAGGRHYTPKRTADWKRTVAIEAQAAIARMQADAATRSWARIPLDEALVLKLEFRLAIPPSWPLWKRAAAAEGVVMPTGKPDLDNLVKAVKDALTGVAWKDDAAVVELQVRKTYTVESHGVQITIGRPTLVR